MLHTENQHPRLPGSCSKGCVVVGGWWCWVGGGVGGRMVVRVLEKLLVSSIRGKRIQSV
jgi:hypothetical protein